MSQLSSSGRTLRSGATGLLNNANALVRGEGALLLRFYGVECLMKARYLSHQLATPYGDSALIPNGTFGSTGHDLDAGRKALRAPASVPRAPTLRLRNGGRVVDVQQAHQVWRYHIPHEGGEDMDKWLNTVIEWLEEVK
jgi:hypothetical protein